MPIFKNLIHFFKSHPIQVLQQQVPHQRLEIQHAVKYKNIVIKYLTHV